MVRRRRFPNWTTGAMISGAPTRPAQNPLPLKRNRVIPHAVVYFTPDWGGPSGHAVQVALASGEPHIYVQQGAHQGGYADEIAIDPINLQPGDETLVATRLREELTRR